MRAREVVHSFVERGEIAGAVVTIERRGQEAAAWAIGSADLERRRAMQRDTIFRIASMTKPIVTAALLALVDQQRIGLFDGVERWLPELSQRSVLRNPEGALDDVVPAETPITLHHVLSYQMGYGWGATALRAQFMRLIASPLAEAQAMPHDELAPDAWMQQLGALPLACAPGTRWLYHVPGDVAGVLIARITGKPLESALRELILDPLGMSDTRFSVGPGQQNRLAALYTRHAGAEQFRVVDDPERSRWATPPLFPSGGGGLVSTADDFQRFSRMLLRRGTSENGQRIVSRKLIEAMSTDYLTPAQHSQPFGNFDRYDLDDSAIWTHRGFGYGVSVRVNRVGFGPSVGTLSWPGAFGTTWLADPSEDLLLTLLVQRVSNNPFYTRLAEALTEAVYRAIDD